MAESKEKLEKLEIEKLRKPAEKEPVMIESRKEDINLPPEVESWFTRVEKNNTTQQISGDPAAAGQVFDDQTLAGKMPKIVLPTTRKSFVAGFKKALSDAGRWLSEFVFRLIKKNQGQAVFKEE